MLRSLLLSCSLLLYAFQGPIAPQPMIIGEKAPLFYGKDQRGHRIELSNYLKKGPVLLCFYRSLSFAEDKNRLAALEDSLVLIEKKGIRVMAISPEKPGKNIHRLQKQYSFPILYDENSIILKAYRLRYTFRGISTKKGENSPNAFGLVPATYLLNAEGMVIFAHFDRDIRKRAAISALLKAL